MSDAHRKAKTPDQTRRALLEAAARQAIQHGIAALSLPAVAAAAGVTKGAVFHHFGSKQGLSAALCTDLLTRIDAELDAALMQDAGGFGCFTRAYVTCTFAPQGASSPWSALSLSALTDPALARIWSDWMRGRLAQHAETDDHLALQLVRLATDGFWLASLQGQPPANAEALRQRLLAATHPQPEALSR